MTQEMILTQTDLVKRLKHVNGIANMMVSCGMSLSGWKSDHDMNISEVICTGDLSLGGAVIKGGLYVRGAEIGGSIYLDGAKIEDNLILSGTSVGGSLDLSNAFINGNLNLEKIAVKGLIKLATKSGPKMIFVSPNMAELVHWAAPTIPLVVVR